MTKEEFATIKAELREELQAEMKASFEQELKTAVNKKIEELEDRPLEAKKAREFISKEVNSLILKRGIQFLALLGVTTFALAWGTIVKVKSELKEAESKAVKISKTAEDLQRATAKKAKELRKQLAATSKDLTALQGEYVTINKKFQIFNDSKESQFLDVIQAIRALPPEAKSVMDAVAKINNDLTKELEGKVDKNKPLCLLLERDRHYSLGGMENSNATVELRAFPNPERQTWRIVPKE